MSFGAREAMTTVFGMGLLRPAPGTWGSLPPCVLVGGLWLAGASPIVILVSTLGVLVVFSASCIVLGPWAETRFGRKDASQIVADESAGQSVALLAAPWAWIGAVDIGGAMRAAAYIGAAFLLFRLFDITKPPPAAGLQRLPHGWGVLVDDLIAGLYALAIIQVVWRFML